jgi:hypothetical protein
MVGVLVWRPGVVPSNEVSARDKKPMKEEGYIHTQIGPTSIGSVMSSGWVSDPRV